MAVSYRVSSRYAKSLLDLAEERKVLDAVRDDMVSFVYICEESRDLTVFLESPVIDHFRKAEILRKIFGGKVNELTMAFIDLLSKKGREAALEGISKEFLVQYNLKKGIQSAKVETAIPLSAALKDEFSAVVKKATGKEVVLEEAVNEELIGGYILRVDDRQIDSSVKGQLRRIKQNFQQGS